ncbi:MAG: diguanylate cyclase domain-containing protein, partial [Anaerolineales bacterium]
AQVVSEKVIEGMKKIKYILPDGTRLKIGISGGIALYPIHAHSGPDLLRAADAALYHAKKFQRGTFEVARGITGPLSTYQIGQG